MFEKNKQPLNFDHDESMRSGLGSVLRELEEGFTSFDSVG